MRSLWQRVKCRARAATAALGIVFAGLLPSIVADVSYAGDITPPPGIVAASVEYTGRITVDGPPVTASIKTPKKNGVIVFDGVAGQRINIGFSGATLTQGRASVYRPDGEVMAIVASPVTHYYWTAYKPPSDAMATKFASFSPKGGSLDLAALPSSGTYTIVINPGESYTGDVTVTVSTELTGDITPQGAAVPIAFGRFGQNARYTFSGITGQTVSLQLSGVSIESGYLSILKPDGGILGTPTSFGSQGAVIDTQVLPASGTYAVLIDPGHVDLGQATLALYNTPDISGTIMINEAPVTSTLTVPGQRARYTFNGTAGQWVNLGLTSVTTASSVVSMLNPDGTTLVSTTIGPSGGSLDPATMLPASGTYTIAVDPVGYNTGSMALTLTSPLIGTVSLDGPPAPINFTKPGSTARYTFSGTAGQWVNLGFSPVTVTSSTITLLNQDGTVLASTSVGRGGGGLKAPSPLPATGTYTIVVDPTSNHTGTITVTPSTEVAGSVTINTAATPVTINRAGQNARYTLAGPGNQQVTVKVTGNTFNGLTVSLYTRSGILQTEMTRSETSFALNPVTLLTPDLYTITVSPMAPATGKLSLQVTSP
jgi:hypothetical protein